MITIGILALQGNFAQHHALLQSLRLQTKDNQHLPPSRICAQLVRSVAELQPCHGLIIPGGESTTMRNLLQKTELFSVLCAAGSSGFPLFGVCAGVILLATHIRGTNEESLGVLDIEVERNGYGRQIHSFETEVPLLLPAARATDEAVKRTANTTTPTSRSTAPAAPMASGTETGTAPTPLATPTPTTTIASVSGVFIRAPIIHACADNIEVLARHAGTAVVVRDGSVLGATFHPEVKADPTLHRFFLTECIDRARICADYLLQ